MGASSGAEEAQGSPADARNSLQQQEEGKGVAGAAAVQAVRRGLVSLQQQEEGQGGGGSSSSAGSERGLVLGPVS